MKKSRWLLTFGVVLTVGCGSAELPPQNANSASVAAGQPAASVPAASGFTAAGFAASNRTASVPAASAPATAGLATAGPTAPELTTASSPRANGPASSTENPASEQLSAAPTAASPPAADSADDRSPGAPAASQRLTSAAADSRLRSQVAAWKRVPYRDNGTTKSGIGNAGFTRALVKTVFDVTLPDKVDGQMRTGKLVDPKAVEPGDLVFFDGKGFGPFRSRSVAVALARGEAAIATKELGVTIIKLSDDRWSDALKTARRVSTPPSKEAPDIDIAAFGNNRNALLNEIAKAWVGTLYRQGGTTFEGIGNDEFIRSIYEAIYDAELEGEPKQWAARGKAVKRADLEPGDIILYDAGGVGRLVDQQHAGMFLGNGTFVHAVRGSAVTISRLDDPKWRKAYSRARRIPPADDVPAVAAVAPARAQTTKSAARVAAIESNRSLSDSERRLREATAAWLGTPYKLGGNTKSGVDCSAFVRAVYSDVYKYDLPRTAEEQERLGSKIDRRDLQTGDLIFFRTKGMGPFFKSRHVGVYLGNNEFAQASGSLGVNVMPLSNRYWSKKYEGARRLKTTSAN